MRSRNIAWWLNAFSLVLLVMVPLIWLRGHRGDRLAPRNQAVGGSSLATIAKEHPPSRSLTISLSLRCLICRTYMGFYRELIERARGVGYAVAVTFPESVEQGTAFLRKAGIERVEVRQTSGSASESLEIPTISAIYNQAAPGKQWSGRLTPVAMGDVFVQLGLPQPTSGIGEEVVMTAVDFRRVVGTSPYVVTLDTRPRTAFLKGHIRNAVNIPVDELSARVPIELPSPLDFVLIDYCGFCDQCEIPATANAPIPPLTCRRSAMILRQLGFRRVYVLQADLDIVSAAGIAVTRSSTGNGKITSGHEGQGDRL